MSTEAARTARELQMLEGMVDCAHALGLAFGAAAKGETEAEFNLERFDAFQKCFLAVRMGIRLCMTLRAGRPAAALVRPAAERPEALERERSEGEARERPDPCERERDRDYEPVSLPRFLATLGVVAREAGRLEDRLPADATRALPALRTLLAQAQENPSAAQAGPPPAAGVALLARPAPPGRTRGSLLGSAAVAPGPRGLRPWSGFR
ncbi:MAG: hypothetical protein EPO51_09730 [Phenylobacterium sp.]|uniref:hypothetical protein n=1 Tax=Phenylobacterium sp. TaxID=1871053 RepID=UPI00121BEAC9|nr:hypothetical protein [Phenylobacterium sp.]TAJ72374.1 MAG: hypothetical protein EPO51_09730 [Phenylobacterium sp.]